MSDLAGLDYGWFPIVGRWTNSLAYYLPAGFTRRLCDAVSAASSLGPVDVFLNDHIKHGNFPNSFIDAHSPSQCGTQVKQIRGDLYVSLHGRQVAARSNIIIEIGMDPDVFRARVGKRSSTHFANVHASAPCHGSKLQVEVYALGESDMSICFNFPQAMTVQELRQRLVGLNVDGASEAELLVNGVAEPPDCILSSAIVVQLQPAS